MKKGLKFVLGAIGLIVVGGAILGNSGNENETEKIGEIEKTTTIETTKKVADKTTEVTTVETTNTTAQNKSFRAGDVVETKNLRISYISCGEYVSDNQFIQPNSGNKFIYFEFEFENISDTDEHISSLIGFDCYADNNSCEQNYLTEDDLSASLSPGRKVKGKVSYEVPMDAKTIELEYVNNAFTSDRIIFLYN